MDQHTKSRLIDYLDGLLPDEERQALEAQLSTSGDLRAELESLRQVLHDLEETPEELPGPALRKRFYGFLEAERKTAGNPSATDSMFRLHRSEWIAAAAVALLAIGLGFGALWQRNLRQQEQINALVAEVQMTRKMMVLSMLEQPSASQRIKALNTVQQEPGSSDQQVVRALLNTLNTDDNINVRVKAAEALLEFADRPGVVAALVSSLEQQHSPEVQIALIDVLVAVRTPDALGGFRRILARDEVLDIVRTRAAAGIQQLM